MHCGSSRFKSQTLIGALQEWMRADLSRRLFSSSCSSSPLDEGQLCTLEDTGNVDVRPNEYTAREAEDWAEGYNEDTLQDVAVLSLLEKQTQMRKLYSFTPAPGSRPVVLTNLPKTVLREDVLHFLPPLGLSVEDVRPAFTTQLRLAGFWVALSSEEALQAALARDGAVLGQRNVSVRQATPEEMLKALESRFVGHSRGRYVLLTGLHPEARADEIMNLFLGFDVMARAINILKPWGKKMRAQLRDAREESQQHERQAAAVCKAEAGGSKQAKAKAGDVEQAAIIRFASFEEANRAIRMCNHSFVKTRQIHLRVLI